MKYEIDQFAKAMEKKFTEMEQRITDLEERCDELEAEPTESGSLRSTTAQLR